jgi:hypothetical protein
MKEMKNNNSIVSKLEEVMELFIKDSLINFKLQKITIVKTNKLFIDKDTKN